MFATHVTVEFRHARNGLGLRYARRMKKISRHRNVWAGGAARCLSMHQFIRLSTLTLCVGHFVVRPLEETA
jgi:hypothetical protein